jgi:hypothetical protein
MHKARFPEAARVTLIAATATTITATTITAAAIASAAVPAAGGSRTAGIVGRRIAAGKTAGQIPEAPAADAAAAGFIAGTRPITGRTAPRRAVAPIHQPIADRRYAADREQKPHRPVHPKTPLAGPKAATMTACPCRNSSPKEAHPFIDHWREIWNFWPDRPISRCPLLQER